MASSSKRQQTMAKRNREQAVREKRELKLAKKHAAALARNAPPEEVELYGPLSENWEAPADSDSPEAPVDTESSAAPADTDLQPPAEGATDDRPGN